MSCLSTPGNRLTLFICIVALICSCTHSNNTTPGSKKPNQKQAQDSIAILLQRADSAIMKIGEFGPDLEYGIAQATQAEQISNNIGYEKGVGRSILVQAKAYMELKQFDKGVALCRRAMNIFKEWGTPDDQAACLILSAAGVDGSHKKLDEKMAYYEKAAAIYRSGGNRLKEAETKQLIADFYGNDEQLDKALAIMNEVMSIYKEIRYERLQEAYTLLGSIHLGMSNVVEGRRNLLLAVKTAEALRDSSNFMATVYNRLGFSYVRVNDHKSAESYFEKAYAIAEAAHDTTAVTILINNIADTKAKLGRNRESNEFLEKSLRKYPVKNDEERLAITAVIFLSNYLELDDLKHAEIHYNQLLNVYKMVDEDDPGYQFIKPSLILYLQAAGQYAQTYPYLEAYKKGIKYGKDFKRSSKLELLYAISDSAMGRYPSSLSHFRLHKVFSDSLLTVEKSKQLEELLLQYETEKKDKNIILLQSREQAQETRLKEEKNIRYLVIGGSFMLLLFLILLYNRYRLKQKSNRKLQKQQQEINEQNELLKKLVTDKEWLLKEIHHRVKNNLQIAISLLNTQSRHLENEDAIAAIRNSQRRMYAMSLIHQRLYQSDNLGSIDMSWYISELMEFLKDSFEIRDTIKFSVDCDAIALDVVQAIPLGLILNEAITNSIKYAFTDGRKGHVHVALKILDEALCLLSISDNGVGMHSGNAASGSLGMNLMRGLAEQVDGEFNLESSQTGVAIHIKMAYKSRLPG
ncbi:two-component sensor histidine kinase [Filimonas zeae]|nr:tetratricopeptide repeat protein [Filimonas zeae]MDR6340314.1 two-component sensor histidine kinase [Filimonas zeae]